MTADQRMFILSFKARRPDWKLLGLDGVDKLPAVRWKLRNLERMPKERHRRTYEALERVLGQ
ncbi:hypothetical protein [Mesorhizobium sp. BE184]|uniref:hypothetical protein n=1 Tax=Mesorhizobium sp. BE184 TaxID=2817714 RepID=UPI0028629690|nr:hypothetical protein [Mesorhizobium sp. BE184]MDR7033865.1 hypothetical protein [Mesorhizobium sp. BE184]